MIKLARKSIVLAILFLYSCVNITEEIYLEADGSGEYMIYSDMISSTSTMMMGMMSSIYPDASEDSLRQIVENEIWADFPAEVDSVVDFSSQVPDSIKNDPEKKKYIDRMEMFLKGSRAEGYLNSGMRYRFSSVDELQEVYYFLSKNQQAGVGQMKMDLPDVDVTYAFDGTTFSRTSSVEGAMQVSDSSMMVLGELLKDAKSRLIIHLPRKVKSASDKSLLEKKEKDVTYEFDLVKVMQGEQSTDVKVSF